MNIMLEVGLRVVRGPDWKWGLQDDGEGHCGTVVELGKPGSATSPDKTVVVQWDSGSRTNYRVGYQGAFDLRVVDNAPAGVKHPNIICNGCKVHGIAGMRWKCTRCYDYDLCTQCYMEEKHDLNHVFQRFETSSSLGVDMEPRKGAAKVQLKGIFVGAKVVRGPDWDWSNQDGGEGKTGRVIDIRGWDNESGRSVANVTWTGAGATNVYRLGHKGKVDLKYLQAAPGGFYFREHIPVMGEGVQIQIGPARPPTSPRRYNFNVGDKVHVLMDVDALKHMQEGHGGWNPRMAEYVGKVGTVHRVTDRGDIRVQYDGCNNRWTFHPATLSKVNAYSVGDVVRLKHEMDVVKESQKGHGEWIEVMKNALGKLGKVTKIYGDGDLRVCIDGQTWTLNPHSVDIVPGSATELSNTMHANQREEHTNPLVSLLSNLALDQFEGADKNVDKLVREAAQGHLEQVREFMLKHPDKVDCRSSGKTCLMVACHQGHTELVEYLLALGASLALADDDGDTALHYSAFGNQAEVMELLLQRGADIDAVNRGKCSPLHVAVNKQHIVCVHILLKYKCNVNVQDSYGDTALHDAIGKESVEIIDFLCATPGVDFTLTNRRGFNVLHHAALKGNNFATEKLLSRTRQLVDVKKDDGFAALHLASLNGHRAVAETLLAQGQAVVDLQNNRKQTPLLLAVSQGHCSVVELVVSMSANVHAEDEDGDTALHLALMKRASIATDINELEAPTIYGIYQQLTSEPVEHVVALAIACYLIQEGCRLDKKNSKCQSPLDLVENTPMVELLQKYVTQKSSTSCPPTTLATASASGESTSTEPAPPAEPTLNSGSERRPAECAICSELGDENVLFEPCGHRIACEDCSSRMKKCLKCNEHVNKRITRDGRIIACKSRQPSTERLRYLETKIAEIEEAHCCSICMERRRNIAFLCGHGACEKCSATLKICHMCRKTITKKINLY